MDITIGQMVKSKAGRDAGRSFVVIDIVDESFVIIADGALRRVEKPKKKKTRHLEATGIMNEHISEKLKNGLKINNSELRKWLGTTNNSEDSISTIKQ